MNDTAEVYLWGTRIGIIHQDLSKAYSSFEYDENFINSRIDKNIIISLKIDNEEIIISMQHFACIFRAMQSRYD